MNSKSELQGETVNMKFVSTFDSKTAEMIICTKTLSRKIAYTHR